MFSGKTTELLRRVNRHTIARQAVVLVNHAKDDRHGTNSVGTHDTLTRRALSASTLCCEAVQDAAADADVVAIDEGQFFPDVARATEAWADAGKIVIVAALDTRFDRKPFDTMAGVVYDDILKLTAVCSYCGGDAPFTRRITDETAVEIVGGQEVYRAVCRGCYNIYNKRAVSVT